MLEAIERDFAGAVPAKVSCSLRVERTTEERLAVRRNAAEPQRRRLNTGAMLTVEHKGGLGYCATTDLSLAGLRRAIDEAMAWADASSGRMIAGLGANGFTAARGRYETQENKGWNDTSSADKMRLLGELSHRLKPDDRIVDWGASLHHTHTESLLLTTSGGRIHQETKVLVPTLFAVASAHGQTQRRSFGDSRIGQGGFDLMETMGLLEAPERLAREALLLVEAPECPEATMDLVIGPDQMVLQIHESIGHPLELDRILGDERNYAGTSFVTPDMFGTYRYGSDLLNVTFDPAHPFEAASYAFDDEGTPAHKEYLIRSGILERPLGSASSQRRANLPGVANARACEWNRPPMDRMANLNIEPGNSTFAQLIAQVERGVYVETNFAWSIDDSRNKFQFGCEWGQLIENGRLTKVVRNPNYRGISAGFWRSLKGVGGSDTYAVGGATMCGKGEPNQAIRVGHATPACLFADVEVFGGGQ
ncbi:MAG: TldD/PmbA family protein [Alphaproteobacteria bacterium]|nr:TldD/PmbA family protein [Alphaproteobacteria bacterium]